MKESIVLGVIPARGGSKGVPGKNIRPVRGKPLIAYAIECGLKAPSIDHLIVSTDRPEIAEIAVAFGADVPFMRPDELASDTTPTLPVLQHAIVCSEKHYGKLVECVVVLDPTAPLREVEDIEGCIKIFMASDCDAVVSGNVAHRSPYFNMVTDHNGYMNLVIPPGKSINRRQDSPEVFDLNTVAWVYSRRALMEEEERLPKKTLLYKVPRERSIDLDAEFDFLLLDFFLTVC